MKAKDLRKYTDEDLKKMLKDLEMEAMKTSTGMGNAKIKDKESGTKKGGTDMVKRIRRERARILTVLNENAKHRIVDELEKKEVTKENILSGWGK